MFRKLNIKHWLRKCSREVVVGDEYVFGFLFLPGKLSPSVKQNRDSSNDLCLTKISCIFIQSWFRLNVLINKWPDFLKYYTLMTNFTYVGLVIITISTNLCQTQKVDTAIIMTYVWRQWSLKTRLYDMMVMLNVWTHASCVGRWKRFL